MRPAEIFYRMAAGIGGWLILFSHALMLAALPNADCAPGDDTLWRGTLVFAVVAGMAALFSAAGLPWRAALRWAPLAVAPLALYAAWWVSGALVATSFGDASLCAGSDLAPTRVEQIWPGVQLAVLAATAVQGFRYWRTQPEAESPPNRP